MQMLCECARGGEVCTRAAHAQWSEGGAGWRTHLCRWVPFVPCHFKRQQAVGDVEHLLVRELKRELAFGRDGSGEIEVQVMRGVNEAWRNNLHRHAPVASRVSTEGHSLAGIPLSSR